LLYFQKYNNEYDLITAAQRVVIDDTETNIVPLSSGELIKSFSSDVPPSLVLKFCEELQNKSKDLCEILQDRKIKYYDNDYGIKTFNIKNCMLIDSNTTIDFTIRNYLDIFDIENNDNIDNLGKRF
jgi:hypothetical protein